MENYFDKYPYDAMKICVVLIVVKFAVTYGVSLFYYVQKLAFG